jgi:hypothetical protein
MKVAQMSEISSNLVTLLANENGAENSGMVVVSLEPWSRFYKSVAAITFGEKNQIGPT